MKQLNVSKLLMENAIWREKIESLGFELHVNDTFGLTLHESGLALALGEKLLSLEWSRVLSHLRRQKLGTEGDLFAKALRPKGGEFIESVLDLTCGTGRDTLHLYALGLKVVALERDPYLFLLAHFEVIKLGLEEISVVHAEAREFLVGCGNFDIVYFDPMYEEASAAKKRKAAPRKEMQLFYEYFSHPLSYKHSDELSDLQQIIELATYKARRRVIVKRPIKGPSLKKAPYCYTGKSTRYDGYAAQVQTP